MMVIVHSSKSNVTLARVWNELMQPLMLWSSLACWFCWMLIPMSEHTLLIPYLKDLPYFLMGLVFIIMLFIFKEMRKVIPFIWTWLISLMLSLWFWG